MRRMNKIVMRDASLASLLRITYYYYTCGCCVGVFWYVGVYVCHSMCCGGQRTTFGSRFSPSIFLWVLRVELALLGFETTALNP